METIRCAVLIRSEALISMWIPKGSALISDSAVIRGNTVRIIWNYCYFHQVNFRSKSKLCDSCHDLMQKAMSSNVAIASVKGDDYRTHFLYSSKDEAINRMNNANLSK